MKNQGETSGSGETSPSKKQNAGYPDRTTGGASSSNGNGERLPDQAHSMNQIVMFDENNSNPPSSEPTPGQPVEGCVDSEESNENAEGEQPAEGEEGSGFGEIFSTRRPRDAVAGTGSAVKNVGKGIGLGLASLVAMPVAGAKKSGVKGALTGTAKGIGAAACFTVAGIGTGVYQLGRGIFHTPGAINNVSKGKFWNSDTRKWEEDDYDLPKDAQELLADGESPVIESAMGEAADLSPEPKVADREFYDLLGIRTDATSAQVKKAFYKMSMKWHPDKNPDNPEATQMFQKIAEAYQVLSDPERRKLYDTKGAAAATNDMPQVDPSLFFTILFGSNNFEPYVGKLRMATEMELGMEQDPTQNPEEAASDPKDKELQAKMKKLQLQRVVRCAVILAKKLDVYAADPGRPDALADFQKIIFAEAKKQCEGLNGPETLYVIGWVYTNRANQFIHGRVGGKWWRMKDKAHGTATKAKIAGNVVASVNAARKMQKKQEEKMAQKKAKRAEERGDAPFEPDTVVLTDEKCKAFSSKDKNKDLRGTPGVVQSYDEASQSYYVQMSDEQVYLIKKEDLEPLDEDMFEDDIGENPLDMMRESLPVFVDTLWSMSVYDLENTLRGVCTKVFRDISEGKERRKYRMEALLEMGTIFMRESSEFLKVRDEGLTKEEREAAKGKRMEKAVFQMQTGARDSDDEQDVQMKSPDVHATNSTSPDMAR